MVMPSMTRRSHWTGCMVQDGEFRKETPAMRTSVQRTRRTSLPYWSGFGKARSSGSPSFSISTWFGRMKSSSWSPLSRRS